MARERYRGNRLLLVALLAAAVLYLACQPVVPVAKLNAVNGGMGVLLGLFICSRPAANGIDLFFLERGGVRLALSGWSGLEWLLLNAVVMIIGWVVIVVGASHIS